MSWLFRRQDTCVILAVSLLAPVSVHACTHTHKHAQECIHTHSLTHVHTGTSTTLSHASGKFFSYDHKWPHVAYSIIIIIIIIYLYTYIYTHRERERDIYLSIYLFLCVYVCPDACVCAGMHTYVCDYVEARKQPQEICPHTFWNSLLLSRLDWLASEPPGTTASPTLGLQVLTIVPMFLFRFWGSSSDYHTCKVNKHFTWLSHLPRLILKILSTASEVTLRKCKHHYEY